MLNPFRKKHILSFFEAYEKAKRPPLDLFLNRYLRAHKSIGSNDRKIISDAIYGLVRRHGFTDLDTILLFLEGAPIGGGGPSLSQPLFALIENSLGKEKAEEFNTISNGKAPIALRVNTLKTTREALMNGWKDRFNCTPTEHSPIGIVFHKKINFYILPEFQKGLFEVQDEGSQLVGQLALVKPGDHVLDYCAGAGGKSLTFGPRMQNQGQLYLHDIRKEPLESAKKRLGRAGIQNYQIVYPDEGAKLERLKGRMDWVFADVPCSGSGTWRRNPDQKWKFTPENLAHLISEQREIFKTALTFLKPRGKIVYATCSVLPEENQRQIDYFCETHNLELDTPPLSIFPTPGGMDGFFGAVLVKKVTIC